MSYRRLDKRYALFAIFLSLGRLVVLNQNAKEAVVKLRVDTSELTFLLVTGPVPVRDYEPSRSNERTGCRCSRSG